MKLFQCLVVAAALAPQVHAATAPEALQKALQADLQNYLDERRTPEHLSALSLSVSLHGQPQTIYATAGTTQYAGGEAVTPASLFQIGSNTKAFTAVILLQLEAEGRLSIDDPLGKYLPQYPAWRDISIRRLINMTSGIPTYDNTRAMQRTYAASPHHDFTPSELIAYVYPDNKDAPPPVHGWSYSNTGYILAELIIERVTGHSYGDELRQRFFTDPKLHLQSTYYEPHQFPEAILQRMVSGYFFSNTPDNAGLAPLYGKDQKTLSASWTRAAGGIVSTPTDLTHWARALYRGALLKPAQQRELESLVSLSSGEPLATVDAAHPRGFGLGVTRMYMPPMGNFWFYQGETLGNRMIHLYSPEADVVIALGMNSAPNEDANHAPQLLAALWKTLGEAGQLPGGTAPPEGTGRP
jgi:D-alanyl-D-alanine carboxypeptidase